MISTVSKRSTAGSSFIVLLGSGGSALVGFGLQIVVAHYYGTISSMDAFVNASTIPTILFGAFNTALVSALVPAFSSYIGEGQDGAVRSLGSTVINLLLCLMSILATISWILAPAFVPIIAHGFSVREQEQVVTMVRWLIPGIVATSIAGVCTALLNVYHRFLATSLVLISANVVTISLVVILHHAFGIYALVIGTLAGLFAQLFVQIPSILRYRLYSLEINWRHPGLRNTLILLAPILLGSGASQINLSFDRYFASMLPTGSTAAISYTTKLAFVPIQIGISAIWVVTFPLIANQFASADHSGMRKSVSLSLRMVGFIVLPCALGLSALAQPIVQTLFERGAFGPKATNLCASFIPFACISLVSISFNGVLSRACYACRETRNAAIIAGFVVLFNVALSSVLLRPLGGRGLLLANGLAGFLSVGLQAALLWRLMKGIDIAGLATALSKMLLAAMAMALAVIPLSNIIPPHPDPLSRIIRLGLLLFAAASIYIAVSKIVHVNELSIVWESFKKKLRGKKVSLQA